MPLLTDYPQLQLVKALALRRRIPVYLVGGFLRDKLLGRACLDFDFAIKQQAIPFAKEFARRIKGAFVALDDEHGCGRVVKKEKGRSATYDFADFRAGSLTKDLQHRDFTINTFAIALNKLSPDAELSQVLLDPNKGMQDLRAKSIRMTSNATFQEDPLRLLRAFSLRAQLDFRIEAKTLTRVKKERDLIRNVAVERIRDELFKVLETSRAAVTLKAMDRIGLLEKIIPQVTVMYHVRQGTYHHLDVWPHSLETVVQLEKLFTQLPAQGDEAKYLKETLGGSHSRGALLKLAALLHDIGKPESRKREEGRISFHGHERIGKAIVRHISRLLKLSTRERFAIEDMTLWHLRPGYLSNFKIPSERAIFRYFRDTREEAASVALLSLADQRATCGPLTTAADQRHHEKICLNLLQRYFAKRKEKPFVRLINGDDLIRNLKLTPSPLFAKILAEVEEQQATGKIRSKSEALDLAKKIAK
jgi:poly(A) polymerase